MDAESYDYDLTWRSCIRRRVHASLLPAAIEVILPAIIFPGWMRGLACFAYRYLLGNIWNPDPDRCWQYLEKSSPRDDDHFHVSLYGWCSLRRSLLTDFRYNDHGFRPELSAIV